MSINLEAYTGTSTEIIGTFSGKHETNVSRNVKGLFTPSDSVTVTVTNEYATHSASHSARQRLKGCRPSMLRWQWRSRERALSEKPQLTYPSSWRHDQWYLKVTTTHQYSLATDFCNVNTVCNITVIPFTYGFHQVRPVNVIDINIIFHIVFTMFVDFKTG